MCVQRNEQQLKVHLEVGDRTAVVPEETGIVVSCNVVSVRRV